MHIDANTNIGICWIWRMGCGDGATACGDERVCNLLALIIIWDCPISDRAEKNDLGKLATAGVPLMQEKYRTKKATYLCVCGMETLKIKDGRLSRFVCVCDLEKFKRLRTAGKGLSP